MSGRMQRLLTTRPGAVVASLIVISTIMRWRAGALVPAPWFTPDEQTYAALARNLYATGSLGVLGRHVPFYSLVYPAVAAGVIPAAP